MNERATLEALRANPDDEATRLVYADLLDERDEARKAAYLRLECAIAANWRREWKITARLDATRRGLDPAWVDAAGRPYNVLLWRNFDPRPVRPFPRYWAQGAAETLATLAGVPLREAWRKVSGRSDLIATLPHSRACQLRFLLLLRPEGLEGADLRDWPAEPNVRVRLAPPGVQPAGEGGGKVPACSRLRQSLAGWTLVEDLDRIRAALGFAPIAPGVPASPGR